MVEICRKWTNNPALAELNVRIRWMNWKAPMLIGLVVCLWKIWKAGATSHGNTKTIAAIRLFAMNQFSLLTHHLRCQLLNSYYRNASAKSSETKPFYYSIENCTGFSFLENIECNLLTGPQIYDNRDTFSYGKEIPLCCWNEMQI